MPTYNYSYQGVDRGRESSWREPMWGGVLRILADHEGENLHDSTAPVYDELARAFPDEAWTGSATNGFRSFFRDYPFAWTTTGVMVPLRSTGGLIELTDAGRAVLGGSSSRREIFLQMMERHSEDGEGRMVNPFRILATAFLESRRSLSFNEIAAITQNYRPGEDSLDTALQYAASASIELDPTPKRRLRHILELLVEVGAISQISDGEWLANDHYSLYDLARISPNFPPHPDESTSSRPLLPASQIARSIKTIEAQQQALVENSPLFDPSSIEDARERTLASIVRRRGQPAFRRALLTAYDGKCAITECNAPAALEAAHLLEYLGPLTNHPTNGMLLRSDIHALWDLGLVSADSDTMTVLVSSDLNGTEYEQLRGKLLVLPAKSALHPDKRALDRHRAQSGL